MDEAGARAVLERVAGEAAPPARIHISLARRNRYTQPRWRRAACKGPRTRAGSRGGARSASGVGAAAPRVTGHGAFGATPFGTTSQGKVAAAMLVGSSAPGGGARLSGPSRRDALKIAGNVTF